MTRKSPAYALISLLSLLSACSDTGEDSQSSGMTSPAKNTTISDEAKLLHNTLANPWYQSAEQALAQKPGYLHEQRKAKNIILFVGDGMGIATITAARILAGQERGQTGEEYRLSFESFPYSGLSKTYNVDAQTPDSAGTMTALITGVKTNMGALAVDENTDRNNCSSANGHELISALELAELAGKASGIVTTARITHATPAATYAKSVERNWEGDADLPNERNGCEDIASQLIHFEKALEARFPGVDSDGIEVAIGGGRRAFLPESEGGNRKDGRNLVSEWKAQYPSGHYLETRADFNNLSSESSGPIFGLFNNSHMRFEADRKNAGDEPSLVEITTLAINRLSKNERGFFLMVEAGRIDHGHHAGSAYNALHDTVALSEAVAIAAELTHAEDTLIIVTADHSHVFSIAGYPKRGNPILGKVVSVGSDKPTLADDGLPYTTLAYANGPGHAVSTKLINTENEVSSGSRKSLADVDTEAADFHQQALVPLQSETHSGEDVAIYARGPGASLISGSNEQHVIFHVMNHAGDLLKNARITGSTPPLTN